jgi:hypothetical protein
MFRYLRLTKHFSPVLMGVAIQGTTINTPVP